MLTRHLVWTLVDPPAAFAEWLRILRPGGRLLIIDGDFLTQGPTARRLEWISARVAPGSARRRDPGLTAQHWSSPKRVDFSERARVKAVVALLMTAGFTDIKVDRGLSAINLEIARHAGILLGLKRAAQHRYAISAARPAG